MSDSLLRVRNAEGRRVVVVMTDGRDENNAGNGPGSTHKLDGRAEDGEGHRRDGLRDRPGHEPGSTAVLQQMADLSGGRAFFPADVTGSARRVPPGHRRPAAAIRARLHVDAHPARRQLAQVEIRIKSAPAATIRPAGGYFAPAK